MSTLSVVIPTYNNESTIGNCLETVKWANEIVVVDMFSTDNTVAICRRYTDKIFQRDGRPMFNVNVNFGLDKATGDWILTSAADHFFSGELANEMQDLLIKDDAGQVPFDLFTVPQHIYCFGKHNRYGINLHKGTKAFHPVLLRKGMFRFPCKQVHESPILYSERIGRLKNHYDHPQFPTVSSFIAKANLYTDLDVQVTTVEQVTPKSLFMVRIVYWMVRIFLRHYLVEEGWRDGEHGFFISMYWAVYLFIERSKRWEKYYKATHEVKYV
jgi:glycosyltransferase involved in cell wall biosynthesis